MTSRVLGALGRVLITAGLIVAAFVVYQLWGTGLLEARSQDQLDDEFATRLAAVTTVAPPTTTTPTTTASTTTLPPATTVPPATATPPTTDAPADIEVRAPAAGEPLAVLEIPSIGLRKIVVEGATLEVLKAGPGHYPSNPLPGNAGNAAIAGHRTTWGQPFNRIDDLEVGDRIGLATLWGEFTYEVMASGEATTGNEVGYQPGEPAQPEWIVRPEDTWVLGDFGDDRLTLTACHPIGSARERIIVAARLVEDPVAVPPPAEAPTTDPGDGPGPDASEAAADLDEGLGGDPDSVIPSLVWGAVTLAVWGAMWLLVGVNRRFALAGLAAPLLAAPFYPHEIQDMWRWAVLGIAIWLVVWSVTGLRVRWQRFSLVAPIGLLALIPCFYYVDRYLPTG